MKKSDFISSRELIKLPIWSKKRPEVPWYLQGGPAPIIVYQPKGAASQAESYINLVNPGTLNADASVYTPPAWDTVNGWKGNGNSALRITTLAGSNWTFLVRFSNVTNNLFLMGVLYGTTFYLQPNNPPNVSYAYGGSLNKSPVMTGGILGMAERDCYRNGVYEGSMSGTDALDASIGIFGLFAGGSSFAPGSFIACYIQGIAVWNTKLNSTQMANVTSALQKI